MYIDRYRSSLPGEVDVVLIGVTNVIEPGCAAMFEAAAIVEAEWIRLNRTSDPARHPAGDSPAARRCPRRTRTKVSTESRCTGSSTHARGCRPRWRADIIRARERSPPARA